MNKKFEETGAKFNKSGFKGKSSVGLFFETMRPYADE